MSRQYQHLVKREVYVNAEVGDVVSAMCGRRIVILAVTPDLPKCAPCYADLADNAVVSHYQSHAFAVERHRGWTTYRFESAS